MIASRGQEAGLAAAAEICGAPGASAAGGMAAWTGCNISQMAALGQQIVSRLAGSISSGVRKRMHRLTISH